MGTEAGHVGLVGYRPTMSCGLGCGRILTGGPASSRGSPFVRSCVIWLRGRGSTECSGKPYRNFGEDLGGQSLLRVGVYRVINGKTRED